MGFAEEPESTEAASLIASAKPLTNAAQMVRGAMAWQSRRFVKLGAK